MNAEYWTEDAGQLEPGMRVDTGHRDKDAAERAARACPAHLRAVVRRLTTHESDRPIEDPRYEPFPSARWCVIVRE